MFEKNGVVAALLSRPVSSSDDILSFEEFSKLSSDARNLAIMNITDELVGESSKLACCTLLNHLAKSSCRFCRLGNTPYLSEGGASRATWVHRGKNSHECRASAVMWLAADLIRLELKASIDENQAVIDSNESKKKDMLDSMLKRDGGGF